MKSSAVVEQAFKAFVCLLFCVAGFAHADTQFPGGLQPPSGMTLPTNFAGFEDRSETEAGLCELIRMEKLNQLFPEGAPWMQLGDGKMPPGLEIPGYEHCSFATDPQPSGNRFVDPQSPSISITEIVMRSAADAEARVKSELEVYRTNTSYDVQLTPNLGGDAFRFESKSVAGQVLVLISRGSNILFEEWLHWPREIVQRDQVGAEQLMAIIVESAK